MAFIDLARRRYSVRRYTGDPVPKDLLDRIIEAGMVAPTAKNLQPQRVHVIMSPEGLAKIDSLTTCRYGAPVVLLVTYNEDEMWRSTMEEGISSGVEDSSIVATHMMLEAADLGLGSLWINLFPNSEAVRAFGLPENERAVLLMDIGYPAEGSEPSARHEKSRPVEDLVDFLRCPKCPEPRGHRPPRAHPSV